MYTYYLLTYLLIVACDAVCIAASHNTRSKNMRAMHIA